MKIKIELSVDDEDRIVLNALKSYRTSLKNNYKWDHEADKEHNKKAVKALNFIIKDFGG
jgi:hypothetical protein